MIKLAIIGASIYLAKKSEVKAPMKETDKKFFRLDSLFKKYGSIWSVDWKLLKAIAMQESSLGENPRVKKGEVSYDGKSYGLMQFTLSTAGWLKSGTKIDDLNNEEYSINLAGQFFNYLSKRFSGNVEYMVMAYNMGEGNVKRFDELKKLGKLKDIDFKLGREYYQHFKDHMKQINEAV